MKLASRYAANFGRCSPFQRRAVCPILRRFIANRSSFYRSFRRISYRPLPVHFPRNFFSPSSVTRVWLVTSRFTINIETNIVVSSYAESDERSLFTDER